MAKGDTSQAGGNGGNLGRRAAGGYSSMSSDPLSLSNYGPSRQAYSGLNNNLNNPFAYSGLTGNPNGAYGAYQSISQNGGGADPNLLDDPNSGYGSMAASGGGTPSGFDDTISSLKNFQWDPTQVGNINNSISGLTGLAGDYKNYAATGGFDDAAKADYRARSNSIIPSYYANEQNNLNTLASTAHGNPYAIGAMQSKLAREGSQGASDAGQATEANLNQQINANRQAGLAGEAGAYGASGNLATGLAQGEAGSKLYGLISAGNLSNSLNSEIQKNKLAGLAGLSGNKLNLAQLLQSGRLGGAAGMAGLEGEQGQLGLGASGQGQNSYLNLLRLIQSGQLSGLSGLSQLFGQGVGNPSMDYEDPYSGQPSYL